MEVKMARLRQMPGALPVRFDYTRKAAKIARDIGVQKTEGIGYCLKRQDIERIPTEHWNTPLILLGGEIVTPRGALAVL